MMMLEKVHNSKFMRNVLVMFSGSILSQVIVIIISPLLTRLYTPAELGQFTVFLTICTLLLPILNARYDLLIVSVEKQEEANLLTTLSLYISVIFLAFASLLIFLLNILKVDIFGINLGYLYLVIPFIVIGSINNILNSYMNRLGKYQLMSRVLIVRSLLQSLLQIVSGLYHFSILGLVLAYVVSYFSGLIVQSKEFLKSYKFTFPKKRLKSLFLSNKDQLYYSTPSIFFNGLSYSIIIFLIANLFNSYEVGIYSITVRVLGLPLTLLSLSFSRVFFEKASRDYNQNGEFRSILKKTTVLLCLVSIPSFTLLTFLSPILFPLVFGEEWGDAGKYVAFLAPLYAIRLVVSTISLAIIIIAKQKVELLLQLSFVISCAIVYVITKLFHFDIYTFLGLLSIMFSINYILFYIYIYKNSSTKIKKRN
ncbi:oligosaccharide flippase family protein [Rummeliibacillus sp. JY-2-4R]